MIGYVRLRGDFFFQKKQFFGKIRNSTNAPNDFRPLEGPNCFSNYRFLAFFAGFWFESWVCALKIPYVDLKPTGH